MRVSAAVAIGDDSWANYKLDVDIMLEPAVNGSISASGGGVGSESPQRGRWGQ